jgi:glycosyltransferase involved in cell wall biosynthesis
VQFIERSILSVLNQNYPNLQFIIMDGGSTDGTLDVIRKYEDYLSWRSEPDRGQSDAINKALMLADGELVAWQNTDDIYFPGAFHRLNQIAKARPRAVLYSGTVAAIDRNDQLINLPRFVRPSLRRLLYEGFVMQSQGVFWRRQVQSVAGLCDLGLHYAMDLDIWLRVLSHGYAEFVPGLIGGLRLYEGTKTSLAGERGRREVSVVRKRYGVDDTTLKWRLIRNGFFLFYLLRGALLARRHGVNIRGEG